MIKKDVRNVSTEQQIKEDIEQETRKIFQKKKQLLDVEAELDLNFIDDMPMVGENIYGEAFPHEKPPRVWLEVFAPDVTKKEIVETICHELIHIKYPNLNHEDKEFLEKVDYCKKI